MGNRRMISKTVTQTQRFLKLPLEAQALYFHLIQNSDDDGIVEAFPVVRMIGASDDSLGLLVVKQFIKPLNEEMVYFIVDFHEQNLVQRHHYKKSKYQQLLTVDEKLKNPRINISESEKTNVSQGVNQMLTESYPNISKDNISKDNISKGSSIERVEKNIFPNTTTTPPLKKDLSALYQTFQSELGRSLTAFQIEDLNYSVEEYGADLIIEALREAVRQGKPNFAYIMAILKRWKQDNLMTVELVRNSKATKDQQRKNTNQMSRKEWLETRTEENPF